MPLLVKMAQEIPSVPVPGTTVGAIPVQSQFTTLHIDHTAVVEDRRDSGYTTPGRLGNCTWLLKVGR